MLLTPRAKRLFDDSIDIGRKFNHSFITPEHILEALINGSEGVHTILSTCKIDMQEIKNELEKYISGNHFRDDQNIK